MFWACNTFYPQFMTHGHQKKNDYWHEHDETGSAMSVVKKERHSTKDINNYYYFPSLFIINHS